MYRISRATLLAMVGLLAAVVAGLSVRSLEASSAPPLAAGGFAVSSNASGLPQRPDVTVTPLTTADLAQLVPSLQTTSSLTAAATAALHTAEAEFGIGDGAIDATTGIVSATVDPVLHPMLKDTHAWVITADVDTSGQSPATANLTYHKLCIVISVTSGQYLFAYTADPQ